MTVDAPASKEAGVMLENCGTKVFCVTVGGNLEVFLRIEYEKISLSNNLGFAD